MKSIYKLLIVITAVASFGVNYAYADMSAVQQMRMNAMLWDSTCNHPTVVNAIAYSKNCAQMYYGAPTSTPLIAKSSFAPAATIDLVQCSKTLACIMNYTKSIAYATSTIIAGTHVINTITPITNCSYSILQAQYICGITYINSYSFQ